MGFEARLVVEAAEEERTVAEIAEIYGDKERFFSKYAREALRDEHKKTIVPLHPLALARQHRLLDCARSTSLLQTQAPYRT